MFSDRFFIVLEAGPVHPMAAIIWRHFPLVLELDVLVVLFRRLGLELAQKLLACLLPIGVGKILWIALINHRDLSRAPFDVLGRGNAHPVAMERDFSATRFVFFHILEFRTAN
jgi:hypothetical protein